MSEPAHILVVEANDFARSTIARMLEDRGYRVSVADTPDAMRRSLAGDHGIDAVVLDATLSAQEVDSLALYARERCLPAVMISGHPDRMAFAQTHRLQLLWKPFRRNGLYDAVDKAFASGIHGQRDD